MESISRSNGRSDEIAKLAREFQAFKDDSSTKIKEIMNRSSDLEQIDKIRDAFGSFQYKDVIFNGTAGADTEITHDLPAADPDLVRFIPVRWEFITLPVASPYIYRSGAANRRPWGQGYIILRCNIASATVRMLLLTEST